MAGADYWSFYTDEKFKDVVKHEMQTAAIKVMAEAATTANHTERVAYADEILKGTASVTQFAIGVSTNADVKAAITATGDPYTVDLTYVTESMFNAFAGIYLA